MAIPQEVLQSLDEQLKSVRQQAETLSQTVKTSAEKGLLSAGDLKDETAINLPEVSTNVAGSSADNINNQAITSLASATSQDEFLKAQQELFSEQQKALQEGREAQTSLLEGFKKLFTDRKEQEEQVRALQEEFQIPENQAQIRTLIPEIGALNLELLNMKIAQLKETTAIQENPQYSVGFAGRETNRVAREHTFRQMGVSAEIGAKTMVLDALRGNVETARNLVGDIVSAMQYDDILRLSELKTFYSFNKDFIDGLEKDQKDTLDNIRDYWDSKVENDRQELEAKLNLGVRAAENGVNLGLGANDYKTMSLEDVTELFGRKVGAVIGARFETKFGTLFTKTQQNKGASNAGLPLEEFQGLEYDVQNYFVNSTKTELEALNEVFTGIKDGKENPEDVKSEIDNSNIPPAVKEYLKSRIDAVAPTGKNTESFWQAFWKGVTRPLFNK